MIRGMFLDVLNQGIAAGYLIVAVILARILLKKAPKSVSCFLWLLVGLRLVMPFSFVSSFSLIPSGAEVRGNLTKIMEQNAAGHKELVPSDMMPSGNTDYIDEELIRAIGNNDNSPESVNRPYVFFSIAAGIWLLGMGVMFLYLLISWFRIARKVRLAVPEELYGIKYYRSEAIDSPFLFGLFRARIYVPYGVEAEDLGYVLKHETIHRQRKDYLAKPIGYLLLTVYWFHPLVWAAYFLLCKDIELACDERVIRELGGEHKKEYALALLSYSVNHGTIAACPVAFGETGVKGRVKNVLSYKKPTFWVVAAAAMVIAIVAVCFMTQKVESGVAQSGNGSKTVLLTNEAGNSNANTQTVQNVVQNATRNLGGIENIQITDADERNEDATHHYYQPPEYFEGVVQWAKAFCNRDGKTLLELTDENGALREALSDSLNLSWGGDDNNEPYASFGWSSPWPLGGGDELGNCWILSASDKEAVILYYAWVSDPHITVWREELSYTMEDGAFKVTSEHIQFLDGICVAEDFYKAYPDGMIDGSMMDYYAYNQCGESLNDNAKNPDMAQHAYAGLDAPDTAAIKLLNILNNENKVRTDVEYLNEEQTQAVVTFTFMENASTAKVRMIKPYGENSIWLPQTY